MRIAICCIGLWWITSGGIYSQNLQQDLLLLANAKQDTASTQVQKPKKSIGDAVKQYNPISLTLNGLLTMYQKVISPQISADCLYHTSCSRFSRKALGRFGVIKGAFLSADRLSRCNRVSATTLHPLRFNEEGKVTDPIEWYSVKYHRNHTH